MKLKNQIGFKFKALSLLAISLIVFSCQAFNMYTPQQDVQLGRDLDAQIRANAKEYPMSRNTKVEKKLQSILDEIVKSPHIKYSKIFEYKVELIERDDVINAFAAPGGFIYIYTGLLKFIDNEATLAGILAHEVAHAELRHTSQRMTQAYGMQILTDAIKSEVGDKNADMAANLFSGLALMNNSRDNEYEADEYSIKYLMSTKYYPGAIKFFFDKIKTGGQKKNDFEMLLSTHPLPDDRYTKVLDQLKKNQVPPPNEGNTFYRSYKNFKKSL
jgi:predicted Zn-dependent protease